MSCNRTDWVEAWLPCRGQEAPQSALLDGCARRTPVSSGQIYRIHDAGLFAFRRTYHRHAGYSSATAVANTR